MNTIKTSKTTHAIIEHVFNQPNWEDVFDMYQPGGWRNAHQSTGTIDKRDIVTLHIIADALVKAIPYGLKDQESERRFKGNLTRFKNDSTVQAIQDKYPSVTFGLGYEDLFAATCFSRITWKNNH